MTENPEEIKDLRSVVMFCRELIGEMEGMKKREADLMVRMRHVENGQGFLARRKPPTMPKFPKILRQYDFVPPDERNKK